VTRIFPYLMTAVLSVGFTLIGQGAMRKPQTPADNTTQPTNAAFRDGRYMAKLDLENGRAAHLGVGRWSNDQDRAAYFAVYQQAYPQAMSSNLLSGTWPVLALELARFPAFPQLPSFAPCVRLISLSRFSLPSSFPTQFAGICCIVCAICRGRSQGHTRYSVFVLAPSGISPLE
jgi:hypothetical protein